MTTSEKTVSVVDNGAVCTYTFTDGGYTFWLDHHRKDARVDVFMSQGLIGTLHDLDEQATERLVEAICHGDDLSGYANLSPHAQWLLGRLAGHLLPADRRTTR